MRRRMMFAVATLAAAAFLVACNGDDDGNGGPTEAPPAETQPGSVTLDPLAQEFYDLLQSSLDATYRVRYAIEGADGEDLDDYIIYNMPPFERVDTISVGFEEPSALIISDGSPTGIACSGGPAEWLCLNLETPADPLIPAAGPSLYLEPATLATYDVSEIDGRTIAGQETRCFELVSTEDDSRLEYCLNDAGVPLYSAPLFGVVEAVEYSTDVTEADFQPPVEPTT